EGHRVRRFEIADGQETTAIEYSPFKTTVTDALGRVTSYEWTNIRGMHVVTSVVGSCPSCTGTNDVPSALPTPPPPPIRSVADPLSDWARLLTPPWPLEKWPRAAVDAAPPPGPIA